MPSPHAVPLWLPSVRRKPLKRLCSGTSLLVERRKLLGPMRPGSS